MKMNILLFLIASMFFASCASLNHKPSKETVAKTVKAKIDSRDYIVDIGSKTNRNYGDKDLGEILLPGELGYIHVLGDSLISCMDYDNPYKGDFPPKNYAEKMRCVKYKIHDYKQAEIRRGRLQISFWINVDYSGQDISVYDREKYPEGIIPIHYKLIIGHSDKIQVYRDERPSSAGGLRFD